MNVISLFDGISCGRVALDRAGIPVDRYVAFEIDQDAIQISEKNYSDIERFGDVITADFKQFIGFDLLIGGSPCQSLSSSNVWLKDGEYGVTGTGKSRLFWEFVRAFKTIKPRFFLFENVASMKNTDRDIITDVLGVQPVKVNSMIFSAQNRSRYYWTNIPFNAVFAERMVQTTLQDILEPEVADKYHLTQGMYNCVMKKAEKGWKSGNMEIDLTIARPITATVWKMHRADTDNYVTSDRTPEGRTNIRRLTPVECERLQTLPDGYTEGVRERARYTAIGNGWTVDVIAHILKGIETEMII